MDEEVVCIVDCAELLERVGELSLESARVDLVHGSREHHCVARLHVDAERTRNKEVLTAVESAAILV